MCARDKLNEGLAPTIIEGVKPLPNKKISRIAQYYRLKQKHSLLKKDDARKPTVYRSDVLSFLTSYSRACLTIFSDIFANIEKCRSRSRIPKLRGLLHLIIPVALSLIFSMISMRQGGQPNAGPVSRIWAIMYIFTSAIHFGTQVWMTLVSGLVLYFSLSRHLFGQVQEHLFPFFYMFNGILSFLRVISFIQLQSKILPKSDELYQVIAITLVLVIELGIRIYISDYVVMLKHQKNAIEAQAGLGQEIGHQDLGELVNCPHYMGVLKRFRVLHSYTSVASIVALACNFYHFTYLSQKLCL